MVDNPIHKILEEVWVDGRDDLYEMRGGLHRNAIEKATKALQDYFLELVGGKEVEVFHKCETTADERLAHYTEGWNDKVKQLHKAIKDSHAE